MSCLNNFGKTSRTNSNSISAQQLSPFVMGLTHSVWFRNDKLPRIRRPINNIWTRMRIERQEAVPTQFVSLTTSPGQAKPDSLVQLLQEIRLSPIGSLTSPLPDLLLVVVHSCDGG